MLFRSRLGGHLVTISDRAENDFVFSSFRYVDPAPGSNGYTRNATYPLHWIGLTDSNVEGKWEWSSGETLVFTNWVDGAQPDDHKWVTSDGADYAAIDYFQNTATDKVELGSWWNWSQGERGIGVAQDRTQGVAEIPFIRRGDSAYVIVQGPTWEEAEANAVKLGGHLVTINDAAEDKWLNAQFTEI